MKTKPKGVQFNEYVSNGGTMTIEQWENDGRFDRDLAGLIPHFYDKKTLLFVWDLLGSAKTISDARQTISETIEDNSKDFQKIVEGCREALIDMVGTFEYDGQTEGEKSCHKARVEILNATR